MSLRGSTCALALIVAAGACASNGLKASRAAVATSSYSVADALSGRLPGATARRDTPVRIILRPTDSYSPGLRPLVVVDGVPLTEAEMQVTDLHPAQIWEIYILKPAQAVATYGDRARDGAVLITTRRL